MNRVERSRVFRWTWNEGGCGNSCLRAMPQGLFRNSDDDDIVKQVNY
ncbi:hypothetical protein RRSWK_01337 [Rhodopirellula sp. SWK7]|nr:hypothetical protein RRSWK_01337 [Rhodopirellula sp. SWK7]